ncbi:hypothetical protein P167DRAFT_491664 [Morchella conica CCBAS932]|uniref:F-box domain-containing protein n=2 Tax=Morchella sect. Distantes TaxID=1051054 RepID=A0A3N4KHK5_9PEZI|nr:hypothetical protein P167DRAFT_491664 [Morchella conica CCBAS932]
MDNCSSSRLSVGLVEPPVSPSAPFSMMRLDSPITPSSSLEDVEYEGEAFKEGWIRGSSDSTEGLNNLGFNTDLSFDESLLTLIDSVPFPGLSPKLGNEDNELGSQGTTYSHLSPSPDFHLARRYTDGWIMNKLKPIWNFTRTPDPKTNQMPLETTQSDHARLCATVATSDRTTASPTAGSQAPAPYTTGINTDKHIYGSSPQKRPREEQPRRPSLSSRCSSCVSLYHHPTTTRQKIFLNHLPVEILLLIFEYAYLYELPRCEHKKHFGEITRRSTTDFLPSHPPTLASESAAASAPSIDELPRLPETLRIYRAKTLLYIALTCRQFNDILWDPYIDHTFWRDAARWCWSWLPEELADVQGLQVVHQSNWRNLVGVFMRSENGLFKQQGGGKGGVESFGGSKTCTQAWLWKDEETKKMLQMKTIQKRRLLMACVQPGPDLFHVSHDAEKGQHTISLNLRGGADYFITIDEYGRFSKKPARLPGGLKRNERSMGYFPPDVFEVEGDRFQLVKVLKRRDRSTAVPPNTNPKAKHHPKPTVEEIVTWDLSCVPEYESDPTATVARCTSKDGWLAFNLFSHRDRDDSSIDLLLDPPLDPPEDQRLFCVQAFGYPGCQTQKGTTTSKENMSEKRRGKMRATDYTPMDLDTEEPQTIFRWRREFEYERAGDFDAARRLHYVICNLQLNSSKAVVLIRWNIRTQSSNEELVDRQFQVLDLKTGATIRVLQFPNLYWDHRHHDMCVAYNELRHKKMSRLFNHMGPDEVMGAGNRCTRIHEDNFILTEDKIISGSHDYCNWVWDLNAEPVSDTKTLVFNAERNDAGVEDPFTVLDDFYWDECQSETATNVPKKENWNTKNERAGWWVRTPNQVMCYWHGIANSIDGRYFAACRPGKMFVWDLEAERKTILGFQNFSNPSNTRWLGRLAAHAQNLKHRLRNWFVWEDVLPEQGLWLLFDDLEVIYLDRDDIFSACGLSSGKRTWQFQKDDFTFSDRDKEIEGRRREDQLDEDEDEDDDYYESDEGSLHGIKRRRTNSFGLESYTEEDCGFMFDNEKEMDEFGR